MCTHTRVPYRILIQLYSCMLLQNFPSAHHDLQLNIYPRCTKFSSTKFSILNLVLEYPGSKFTAIVLNLVLKVIRNNKNTKVCPKSSHARCAIYSRDTAIRISSVPRFICKNKFVKISSWAKVMGAAKYFCRPFQ